MAWGTVDGSGEAPPQDIEIFLPYRRYSRVLCCQPVIGLDYIFGWHLIIAPHIERG